MRFHSWSKPMWATEVIMTRMKLTGLETWILNDAEGNGVGILLRGCQATRSLFWKLLNEGEEYNTDPVLPADFLREISQRRGNIFLYSRMSADVQEGVQEWIRTSLCKKNRCGWWLSVAAKSLRLEAGRGFYQGWCWASSTKGVTGRDTEVSCWWNNIPSMKVAWQKVQLKSQWVLNSNCTITGKKRRRKENKQGGVEEGSKQNWRSQTQIRNLYMISIKLQIWDLLWILLQISRLLIVSQWEKLWYLECLMR